MILRFLSNRSQPSDAQTFGLAASRRPTGKRSGGILLSLCMLALRCIGRLLSQLHARVVHDLFGSSTSSTSFSISLLLSNGPLFCFFPRPASQPTKPMTAKMQHKTKHAQKTHTHQGVHTASVNWSFLTTSTRRETSYCTWYKCCPTLSRTFAGRQVSRWDLTFTASPLRNSPSSCPCPWLG